MEDNFNLRIIGEKCKETLDMAEQMEHNLLKEKVLYKRKHTGILH